MNRARQQARLLVVGGHTRNIGKTALVVDLIRAFPEASWTAIKITQHVHVRGAGTMEGLQFAPGGDSVALEEERDATTGADTSRFLAAGASRALRLRAEEGRLAEALPLLRDAISAGGNVILESNTIMKFYHPILYLVVLDPRREDFKASAKQTLDRADAIILRAAMRDSPWQGVSNRLFERKPTFIQPLGSLLPDSLAAFVRENFFRA